MIEVVAACPEVVVIAGDAIEVCEHLLVADPAVAVGAFFFGAAVDEVVEDVDVFSDESAGGSDEAVGAIVVIVGGVGCDGDDGFEAVDAGGCGGEREGAVV